MINQEKSDPIEILLEATKKISPTLISYDIGSLFELVIYTLLKKSQKHFDKIVVVSLYESFQIIVQYWKVTLDLKSVDRLLEKLYKITVDSLYASKSETEITLMSTSSTGLLSEITKKLENEISNAKQILIYFIGLDFYYLDRGEDDFKKLFLKFMLLSKKIRNVKIITVINRNVFPKELIEFMNSYSFNAIQLHAEIKDVVVKYYLEFKRIVFLQYNLNVWEYQPLGTTIQFTKKKVS